MSIDHNGEYVPLVTYNGGDREWLPDPADLAGHVSWRPEQTTQRVSGIAAQLHATRQQVAHVADYLTAVPTREEYETLVRDMTVLQRAVLVLTEAVRDAITLTVRDA